MSSLFPPPQTRVIGSATVGGQTVPVLIDIAWFRYLSQALFDRVGGALGVSTEDLALSQFEDAGIEETKALVYSAIDAAGQVDKSLSAEVAILREREPIDQGPELRAEIAELKARIKALEQEVAS